jgi:O-antigen/teichoic acid export membrane protein
VLAAQLLSNGIYLSIIPLRDLSIRVWRQASSLATMRYATPIMVMGLAGIANEMLGRKMLPYLIRPGMYGQLDPLEVLGIYGNVYKLSIFMSLVIQAFKMGAEPFFFQQGARQDGKAVIATVMHWFVLACVAIWGGISLNLWWLGPIILKRQAYIDALGVVPILLLANLFLGVYYNLTVWFKVTERTNYGYYFGLFGAAITIALNFLLIPLLGYMGSAIATPVSPGQLLLGTAGYSFGLGFLVRQADGIAAVHGSAGEFMWAGYGGTYFWADPKEQTCAVLMTQSSGPSRVVYRRMMKALVAQALVD